jgi:hypothetical protein
MKNHTNHQNVIKSVETLNVTVNILQFQHCKPGGWATLVYENGDTSQLNIKHPVVDNKQKK